MIDFDLNFYFRVIRKWLWLVILVGALAAGAAFAVLSQRQDEYQASTLMNVGSFLDTSTPDIADLRTALESVQTFARLARTTGVIQPAIDDLGLETTVSQVRRSMETALVPNTTLFEITVLWSSPEEAAALANEISNQLIASTDNVTPLLARQIALSEQQITLQSEQLDELQIQLDALNARISIAETRDDTQTVDSLSVQRNDLIQQINQTTSNIASFSDTITQIEQRSNVLTLQEEAEAPNGPVSQNTLLFSIVAGLGAASIIAGAFVLLEALDTTFRTERRLETVLQIPVRGSVQSGSRRALTTPPTDARMLEQYQMLRTTLLYSDADERQPIYILSSPTDAEAKERIVGNLALSAADSGSRVLLIDADLRQSRLHRLMRLNNQVGLVNFLNLSPEEIDDDIQRNNALQQVIQSTETPGLDVVTTGVVEENPIRLLESPTMLHWLELLLNNRDYDFILLNTPPVLLYPDTSALAALTGLECLLITQNAKTRSQNGVAAYDQITQVGGKVTGAIFAR